MPRSSVAFMKILFAYCISHIINVTNQLCRSSNTIEPPLTHEDTDTFEQRQHTVLQITDGVGHDFCI